MWKLFLFLALVASLSIVYCDDSSNDDCQDAGLSIVQTSEESESSSSSSSSSYSSSSSSLSSSSGESSRLSSSSSMASSSSSESASSKITSKTRRINDSDDDSNASNNDASGSGSADVDATTQASSDTSAGANSVSSDDSALSYKCGANEVFSNCTNGGCDARYCSQAGKPVPCVKLDPKSCKKGCVCQPGYLRASNGTCVPRNQCNEGCGDDPNAHPGCGVNCGRTCSSYKAKNPICPLICNLNGCDCNEGYVLDPAVKKCVLPEDCTPECGVNEMASTCANGGCGPWTCSEVGNPVKCVRPAKCNKGCVCLDYYVRNDNGTCVPQGDCPAKPCGKNQYWEKCILGCSTQSCDELGRPARSCPAEIVGQCPSGCRCKPNYYKNADNVCIPKDQCPVTCNGDPNAKPGCGVNCGKTCSTYKIKNPVCPAICKAFGCDCKDGFVFDANLNKCVLPKDCTPICGPNERFDSCAGFGCGRWNCSQLGQPELCIDPAPGGCKNGCTCVNGYLRADNGTCVPQDQCPGANGCNGDPNAKPGCGVNCGRTCSTYKLKNVACPAICALNGCDCKEGYVFDNNLQKCVMPQDCSPICGLNERFDSCVGFGCGRRNCSQLGQPELCIDPAPGACKNGCTCVDGYLRAENGTCVPQDQCPATECNGDPNAKPGCGVNCGKTCSTYKIKNPVCPAICMLNGCDCKDGFVFDANLKKCVLPKDCSPICGLNERFDSCVGFGCGRRNCSQLGQPELCIDPAPGSCKNGCTCVDGYLRAENGTCVPQDQCPATGCNGDPNAKPGCGANCGKTCSTYKIKNPGCPAICSVNGCDCNDGFVFDANLKKCVLPKDCTPICGLNERFDSCAGFGCGRWNCSQLGQPVLCRDPIPGGCKNGCTCVKGYLRAGNGTCVPEDQCPGANGCNGDRNAKPGCGVNCGRTCSTYKLKNVACSTICQINGCDCKDGYVFDDNVRECVLPEQCSEGCGGDPNTHKGCGINCGNTCSTYQLSPERKRLICPRIPCKPIGCDCNTGYVFDENKKKCVLPQDCGCGGDPNAHPGCGVNCGKTCSTYKTKNPICPRICKVGGCDCNDGYVYDANLNKCVMPEDCTPICGLNEQYDSCTNAGCGYKNCSQIGQPQICIDVIASSCIKGCSCVKGYLRAENGTCIPTDQCPAPGCGGDPNAEKGCGYNCGRKCSTYKIKNKSLLCPRIQCKPDKCDCKNGFVFDDNLKKCVRPEECTPICGLNEQYGTCINGGCAQRNCSQLGQPQLCVDVIESSCVKGCVCANGYLRTDNETCIPQDQCPKPASCRGDPNAQPGCGVNCGRTCNTYKSKPVACPLFCEVGGCDCKDGYVFDDNTKKCVLPSQCSDSTPSDDQCPGQNEFFDTCISGCGNQSCDSIGKIINCPIQTTVCRTGCRCKPGFYRNPNNVCVPESECPAPPCPDGEVYSRCPTVKCEGDYCPKTRDSPLTCPVGIVCDKPRCVCGFNSKRDLKTGKCIRISDCPPFKCDGPNESYQPCPATCPGDKCSDYIYSTRCPPYRIGIVVPCQPQCKCNNGYYRNSDGICILGPKCGPKQSTSPVPIVEPITAPPVTDVSTVTTDATAVTTDAPAVTTTASATTGDNSGDAQAGLAKLLAGVTTFNGKFLYDRMKAGKGENIIASPYSVFTPMAQLALYTDGNALKQLTTVLNVPNKDVIRASFPLLASSFDGQTSVNFSMAAKVCSNRDYPLSDGFKKDSVDIIHAEAEEYDFSKPAEAADSINKWVESKTNNRIKDLIKASDLSTLTRIVLVNAIYFKGTWLTSFDPKNTQDADFYLSDGTTKKTKLMYQESQFNYGEVPDLNLTALEMFYEGKNFSMLYVLPNEKDGNLKTAESLQNPANFNKILDSLSSQKVKVYIPPFEINTETDLADILQQEGVTDIFKPKGSGLSGILKKPEETYVSKAVQKAFIKVDEQGSEAAAANGVIVSTRSMPLPPADPIVFRADRPFLFYIRAKGTTLFCGAFVQ